METAFELDGRGSNPDHPLATDLSHRGIVVVTACLAGDKQNASGE